MPGGIGTTGDGSRGRNGVGGGSPPQIPGKGGGVMDLEAQVAKKIGRASGSTANGGGVDRPRGPRVPGSIPKPPKRLPRKNRGPF
jgi:hypothetical protein